MSITRCAVAAVCIAAAFSPSAAGAQEGSPSLRVAALQFATTHGLIVPTENVLVAREPDFDQTVKAPRQASETALAQDAKRLAAVLGNSVADRAARDVLQCVKYHCAAKGAAAVVTVSEGGSYPEGTRVWVHVYLPANPKSGTPRSEQGGIVLLQRSASGNWVGLKWSIGPSHISESKVPPPQQ